MLTPQKTPDLGKSVAIAKGSGIGIGRSSQKKPQRGFKMSVPSDRRVSMIDTSISDISMQHTQNLVKKQAYSSHKPFDTTKQSTKVSTTRPSYQHTKNVSKDSFNMTGISDILKSTCANISK